MNQISTITLFVYGILLGVGGVMGYVSKGSIASLVSGLVFGILALVAGAWSGKSPTGGYAMGLAVAIVVGAFFLKRFMDTKAMMPAGMTLGLSILVGIITLLALLKNKG